MHKTQRGRRTRLAQVAGPVSDGTERAGFTMADFQIRDLERVNPPNGRPYWTARVVVGKSSIDVDTRWGSWIATVAGHRCDIAPHVAAALQAKVRPLEKKEARNAAT